MSEITIETSIVTCEALELANDNMAETSEFLSGEGVEFEVDADVLFQLDSLGLIHLSVAKRDGRTIGYALFTKNLSHIFMKGMKNAELMSLFLAKDERKGFTGYNLLKHALNELENEGYKYISLGVKIDQPMDSILKRLKFTHVENRYVRKV